MPGIPITHHRGKGFDNGFQGFGLGVQSFGGSAAGTSVRRARRHLGHETPEDIDRLEQWI
jgi:hypothetical protein